jgi:hypothetical protein
MYTSSFMAAKVMLAKSSGNVGSHSLEFLGWDKQPTPRISGGTTAARSDAGWTVRGMQKFELT